jgi:dolichol-phosphate mannosyltransferase
LRESYLCSMSKENVAGVVIIPTYNEIENISRMIEAVMALPSAFDLLIVDDSSPDGTGMVVAALQNKFASRLYLLTRNKKDGLGKAYIAGFEWALSHKYPYIFEMDCDFSHNPLDIERLYSCAKEGQDLVIGSRYITGVNVVNWPMGRVLLSYFASKYVRWVTGIPIQDTTAGFKCYRRIVLETLNLEKIRFKGYAFQIELKYVIWKLKFKIKEIPIIFTDRQEGTSKISTGIIKEAVWGVIRLRLSSIRKYKRT